MGALVMALLLLTSYQIGFELVKAYDDKCMDILLSKGQALNGSYLVTGINENNVRFNVCAYTDY
jgi:hypothetical protein